MMKFKVPRSISIECNICKLTDFPTNKSMMDIIWRTKNKMEIRSTYSRDCISVWCSAGGVYRREDR